MKLGDIKDYLFILKYKLFKDPVYKFKSKHLIRCPKCHKSYYQIRRYKAGQNTLCKKCRKGN